MKVLIDTCVVVDVLQKREPFCKDAQEIFILTANNVVEGCLTAKSILDIYYLTHKITHSDEKTREIIGKILSLFAVLDTTDSDCLNALKSKMIDYEDAVMVETAKRTKMDCIITRNIKDYKNSEFTVYEPKELINLL